MVETEVVVAAATRFTGGPLERGDETSTIDVVPLVARATSVSP
jgi:hypothetical protein